MVRQSRRAALALASLALAFGAWSSHGAHGGQRLPMLAKVGAPDLRRAPADEPDADACTARPLRLPSGAPAMLDCADARAVVAQVQKRLAIPARTPDPEAFAAALGGWLDPHGLWSAAPDAPNRAIIRSHARRILAELEGPPSSCEAAREVARVTRRWVSELSRAHAAARSRASSTSRTHALSLAVEAVFQDDPVTRPAQSLAADLGARSGAFMHAFGGSVRFAVDAAAERLFPELGVEDWTRVVVAAAVRAYVPLADAHGQWAPFDEEWSLYAADAAVDPGPKLWGRMMRTALGVRVIDDPMAPLAEDDLVLSIGGVATAGLSIEQLEQLGRLESIGGESVREVSVLRVGETAPRTHSIPLPKPSLEEDRGGLAIESARYGSGRVLVISIPDVPDQLGAELSDLVQTLETEGERPLGIVLDLRGNGGGSTDGAAGAIGVFIPGVPSFPMRRRDGAIEVGHALTPPPSGQWHGPVAALVDGYTASAAEMIAGALASYGRGLVVGTRTFGKGCVQEYFDDRAGAGVLRLTTMVLSLPSGEPLQGVGITPTITLALPRIRDKEALLSASVPPWRGPDVRDRRFMGGARWPAHDGMVGPCRDDVVCSALERLGRVSGRRSAAARPGPIARNLR